MCRYCGYRFDEPANSSHAAIPPDRAQDEATPPPLATPSEGGQADLGTEGTKRRNWRRIFGFSVCIALWVISVPPLAVRQIDEGGGADVAAAYLAVAMFSLGLAALIRGIYAKLRNRPFWSPWLFLIAALLAILSLAGQTGADEETSRAVVTRNRASYGDAQ